MKKVSVGKKIFKSAWDKYYDTMWKIEKSWDQDDLDYAGRVTLTDSVLELIQIEKKLKNIESKYLKG